MTEAEAQSGLHTAHGVGRDYPSHCAIVGSPNWNRSVSRIRCHKTFQKISSPRLGIVRAKGLLTVLV